MAVPVALGNVFFTMGVAGVPQERRQLMSEKELGLSGALRLYASSPAKFMRVRLACMRHAYYSAFLLWKLFWRGVVEADQTDALEKFEALRWAVFFELSFWAFGIGGACLVFFYFATQDFDTAVTNTCIMGLASLLVCTSFHRRCVRQRTTFGVDPLKARLPGDLKLSGSGSLKPCDLSSMSGDARDRLLNHAPGTMTYLTRIERTKGVAISYFQIRRDGKWIMPPELREFLGTFKGPVWLDRLAKHQGVRDSDWAYEGLRPYRAYPTVQLVPRVLLAELERKMDQTIGSASPELSSFSSEEEELHKSKNATLVADIVALSRAWLVAERLTACGAHGGYYHKEDARLLAETFQILVEQVGEDDSTENKKMVWLKQQCSTYSRMKIHGPGCRLNLPATLLPKSVTDGFVFEGIFNCDRGDDSFSSEAFARSTCYAEEDKVAMVISTSRPREVGGRACRLEVWKAIQHLNTPNQVKLDGLGSELVSKALDGMDFKVDQGDSGLSVLPITNCFSHRAISAWLHRGRLDDQWMTECTEPDGLHSLANQGWRRVAIFRDSCLIMRSVGAGTEFCAALMQRFADGPIVVSRNLGRVVLPCTDDQQALVQSWPTRDLEDSGLYGYDLSVELDRIEILGCGGSHFGESRDRVLAALIRKLLSGFTARDKEELVSRAAFLRELIGEEESEGDGGSIFTI